MTTYDRKEKTEQHAMEIVKSSSYVAEIFVKIIWKPWQRGNNEDLYHTIVESVPNLRLQAQ